MSDENSSVPFGQEHASVYDRQWEKLAPLNASMHLLMRIVLSNMPEDARVLCVGAGTGREIIALAQVFPGWQFTAVDPSSAMLDVCRNNVEEHGFTDRCTFHVGYIETLPDSEPFHVATSLLVSQFLVDVEDRRRFFHSIATRLQPGGYLISADIAADMSTESFNNLFDVWVDMWRYSGFPPTDVEKMRASFGKAVAVLPPHQVESLIEAGGFSTPVLFFQTLLIHGWYAVRTTNNLTT